MKTFLKKAKMVAKDELKSHLFMLRDHCKGGRKSQNGSILQETNRTATHMNSQWLWQYASIQAQVR